MLRVVMITAAALAAVLMSGAQREAAAQTIACPAGVSGVVSCFCRGGRLFGLLAGDPDPVRLGSSDAACSAGGGGATRLPRPVLEG